MQRSILRVLNRWLLAGEMAEMSGELFMDIRSYRPSATRSTANQREKRPRSWLRFTCPHDATMLVQHKHRPQLDARRHTCHFTIAAWSSDQLTMLDVNETTERHVPRSSILSREARRIHLH